MDLKACTRLSNLCIKPNLIKTSSNDVITQLPDDILIDILSCLPIKEAARTCVLSRRWKNLWKFYRGCLDFDDLMTKRLLASSSKRFAVELRKYVNWVDQVLGSHQGESIEQFRISFDLGRHHTGTIDSWIAFAAARGVHRLELDLSSRNTIFKRLKDMYDFPTPARLSELCHDDDGLKLLTSLRLESVNIAEEHVLHFLSNCPFLEELSIANAPSLCNLRLIGGAGPAGGSQQPLKLKHLEIRRCVGLEQLEVSADAANLTSFKYEGHYQHEGLPMKNMLFQDVHQLSSVTLGRGHYSQHLVATGFRQLPFPIAQLHTLALYLDDMMYERMHWFPSSDFAKLPNLCHLELAFRLPDEQSMLFVGSFLRASPCLRALVLKYTIDEDETAWRKKYADSDFWRFIAEFGEKHQQLVKGCKYECLKEVEFLGWKGRESDTELFTHLIEAAAGSLDRVALDPRDPFFSLPLRALEDARDRARDLEPLLSSAIKLVVL